MPSPFPGVDPSREARWGDVHSSRVLYARDVLQPRLPGDRNARVEERVFVETNPDLLSTRYPDGRVALTNQTYENGNYVLTTDNSQPRVSPRSEEDAAWAATLLKKAEMRVDGSRLVEI